MKKNKRFPFVFYGGDYNPDQWDEDTINRDMELFHKAGVNLVTLPVFSWAKLEPEEGIYCFEWLDKILEKLLANHINVFLSTPTSAQPAWLSKKYPEVLPVDIAGRKRTHGMRVFFCVNSKKYRERAAAIAEEMAKRYQNYPGLLGWHVANEYGTYCYCDTCQRKYRNWLKERYQTVENLNNKWNTSFWGRTVYDFNEIFIPSELNDDYRFFPAAELDYMRFMTDSTKECFLNEAEILRKYTPDIPVFSNISGYIKKLNQFAMTDVMDVAAWDNYPSPKDDPSFPALKHDLMRAMKGGQSYIIAEQSPNQQNWQPYNKLKRPGQIRTLAYQGIGHGADTCLFFQMRQSIGGQEKFHGAMISHADREDTRIFCEMSRLGKELRQLEDWSLDAKIKADVGIIFDWENWWALELSSGPTKDMDYLEQVHKYYKAFYDNNISVDMLKLTSDFSNYKVIVAPLLYMIKEGVAEKLEIFVKNGGRLITTYMSGLVDENDRCVFGAYPGKLRKMLGIWVEETDALYPEESNQIVLSADKTKKRFRCGFLCDQIHLENAEALAVYGQDFYEGTPCITLNEFGDGKAYYIGTCPEALFLNKMMKSICNECGIGASFETKDRVEICVKEGNDCKLIFIINHEDKKAAVNLGNEDYFDVFSRNKIKGEVVLNPYDVMVLKDNRTQG